MFIRRKRDNCLLLLTLLTQIGRVVSAFAKSRISLTYPAFTYSKLTIETEQGVKYVQS